MRPAEALAARIGLPVRDLDLLEQALVHSSWHHEHRDAAPGHNERLEFLGDAVVNLAISEALYTRHPEDDEGYLSARRAAIVSTTGLSRLASRLDLGSSLLLGEGEAARSGRRRPSLLASTFEAVAGALYLDLGYEPVKDWLIELADPELAAEAPIGALKSPKSRLQEFTQRRTGERPSYKLTDASGFYSKNPGTDVAVTQMIRKATDKSRGIRLGNFVQIRTIIDEETEQIWAGKKSPKEALDTAVTRGNEQLVRFARANK